MTLKPPSNIVIQQILDVLRSLASALEDIPFQISYSLENQVFLPQNLQKHGNFTFAIS